MDKDASANSVFVSSGDVYTAGFGRDQEGQLVALLWKNGAARRLSDGGAPAMAHSVCVSGTDVYVVGFQNARADVNVAMLWKNRAPSQLGPSTALSVFVVRGERGLIVPTKNRGRFC